MIHRLYLVLTLLAVTCPILAAEQGRLGMSSGATFSITLSIQPSMEIKTVTDINLTITNRTVNAEFVQAFCVQGIISERYRLLAYGSDQHDDAFILKNLNGDELSYYVSYKGDPGKNIWEPLSPGNPSTSHDVLARDDECSDLTAFKVLFLSTDLSNAGAGLYSGSLTLLVSPV